MGRIGGRPDHGRYLPRRRRRHGRRGRPRSSWTGDGGVCSPTVRRMPSQRRTRSRWTRGASPNRAQPAEPGPAAPGPSDPPRVQALALTADDVARLMSRGPGARARGPATRVWVDITTSDHAEIEELAGAAAPAPADRRGLAVRNQRAKYEEIDGRSTCHVRDRLRRRAPGPRSTSCSTGCCCSRSTIAAGSVHAATATGRRRWPPPPRGRTS